MKPTLSKNFSNAQVLERYNLAPALFWMLVSTVLILCISYMWFINGTVYNVVERRHHAVENTSLSASLASLESDYISANQKVTLARAHDFGFVDVARVEYASRDGVKTLLSSR